MRVLLDTSAYSALFRGDPDVRQVLENATAILVPAIVVGELYSGFRHGSRYQDNIAALQQFLRKPSVAVADVGVETAVRYAEVDVWLRSNEDRSPAAMFGLRHAPWRTDAKS